MKGKTLIKNVEAGFHAYLIETTKKHENKNVGAGFHACPNETTKKHENKDVGAGFHACPIETTKKHENKNIWADISVCQNEKGITLIALVITIIVLLILAGVTISMGLFGDNGIITRANEAKFKQELSKYIEELQLYSTNKQLETLQENSNSSTTVSMPRWADENYLQDYDTLDSTKTIKDVITSLKDEYLNKFFVLNGELKIVRGTATEREVKWAKDLGVEEAGFKIDENGTLLSDMDNVDILVKDGTLVIPSMVTAIDEGTFSNLGAETIIIPSTVKAINRNAFANNTTLKNLIIESKQNGDTWEGVKTIGERAFFGCSNLETIVMGNSVETLSGRVFEGCGEIRKVTFSENLKTISMMAFPGCSKLEEFRLPDSLESIGSGNFQKLTSVTEMVLPANLQTIESGTSLPPGLKSIDDNNNENFDYDSVNKILYQVSEGKRTKVIKALAGAGDIEGDLSIDENVTSIGLSAFSICTNVTTINISTKVESIANNVWNDNIESIIVAEDNQCFSSIDGNLYNKDGTILYRINASGDIAIRDGVKEVRQGAFRTSGITSITLPNTYEQSTEWNVFSDISTVKLPNNTTGFSKSTYCTVKQIKILDVNGNETDENDKFSMSTDGKYLFNKDKTILYWVRNDVTDISDLPSTVEQIAPWTLSYLKISKLTIPSSVKTIGNYAFAYMTLTEITIPDSVDTIGEKAFTYAGNIQKISIQKPSGSITDAPWGAVCGNKGISWNN